MNDDKINEIFHNFWLLTNKSMVDGANPLAIAGVLQTISLTLYRTLLNDIEYDMMIDNIGESRDRIQKIHFNQSQAIH